jgi:hypothetical protein
MGKNRSFLISFLQQTGTDSTKHTGRSLMDHLVGTYDILKEWKCTESVCIAGGLHSIYGTNVFTKQSLSEKDRPMVRRKFGIEAERLAWLFGILNRPKAIENGFGIDRRNSCEIILSKNDIFRLRFIEAANLIEQGFSLDSWPNIKRVAERHF